jgi:hypothetical protein
MANENKPNDGGKNDKEEWRGQSSSSWLDTVDGRHCFHSLVDGRAQSRREQI